MFQVDHQEIISSATENRTRPDGKKLLFVVNNPSFFLSHRLNIALAAKQVGYRVSVATPGVSSQEPKNEDIEKIIHFGFQHIPLQMSRWGTNFFEELSVLLSLIFLYRRERPDIVHHVTIKPVLYGSIAARITGVPAVVNAVSGLGNIFIAQGLRSMLRKAVVKAIYRFAFTNTHQRVIFQNPDDRDLFIKERFVSFADTAIIRGSGVDESIFAPQPEPPGVTCVVMPSRLILEKGAVEFAEAASLLKRKGVAARFIIVGGEEPNNPVRVPALTIEEWQRDGFVEIWGHHEKMHEVFAKSHIVCLPSYREGNPKALIEAAACGRPIVTANTPGCREIVKDGVNGILVPVKDSEALAHALERLISDRPLRLSFGQKGRELMLSSGYTERDVVNETLGVYWRLLFGEKKRETLYVCASNPERTRHSRLG